MKKTQSGYKCSMQVLYMTCRSGWDFCKQNLAAFAAFRSCYTDQYISDAIDAVSNAENIKDSQHRNAGGKKARIALQESADAVLADWKELKQYIIGCFPPAMQSANLQSAGSSSYSKAAVDNWSALHTLMTAGNSFITENLAALTANNNMPTTFAAKFKADSDTCSQLSATFFNTSRKKTLVATDKNEANKDIYVSLMSMCADAQRVFADNEALRKQFTFSYLVSKASGNGIGSIKGLVTSSLTGKPVTDVTTALTEKYNAITNIKGRYNIGQVAADIYSVTFEKAGYDTFTQDIIVKPGTVATFDLVLTVAQVILKVA